MSSSISKTPLRSLVIENVFDSFDSTLLPFMFKLASSVQLSPVIGGIASASRNLYFWPDSRFVVLANTCNLLLQFKLRVNKAKVVSGLRI